MTCHVFGIETVEEVETIQSFLWVFDMPYIWSFGDSPIMFLNLEKVEEGKSDVKMPLTIETEGKNI